MREQVEQSAPEKDPFYMSPIEQVLGVGFLHLKFVLYLFNVQRAVPIYAQTGEPLGSLQVEMYALSSSPSFFFFVRFD
jgi:hypothetical protein